MPAEGPAGIAESAEQRAIGVDTDQVATVRARGYLSDDLFGVRGERNGRRLAAPILGIEQQVGICRQVLQQVAQLLPCVRQATAVLLALAAEGHRIAGVTLCAEQLQGRTGLLRMAGLAHPGAIETDEVGGFGAVAQGKFLAGEPCAAQPSAEGLEMLGGNARIRQAHCTPPNTATSENTQAGDACPTRTA